MQQEDSTCGLGLGLRLGLGLGLGLGLAGWQLGRRALSLAGARVRARLKVLHLEGERTIHASHGARAQDDLSLAADFT